MGHRFLWSILSTLRPSKDGSLALKLGSGADLVETKMTSKFFTSGNSSSESSSDEEEYSLSEEEEQQQSEEASDEEEDESEEDEESSSSDDDAGKAGASKFLKDQVSSDESEDEDKVTVVKSAKDKRLEELETVERLIENAVKINDWSTISNGELDTHL